MPLWGIAQRHGNTSEIEKSIRKLSMAQLAISSMYVDSVDDNKLAEDAINGMLSHLDPHSAYTYAEETRKMNEPLKGNFDGIGVQFNMLDDTLMVIQPVAKGPSEKVGILAGDRIVTVNDTAIAGVKMSLEEIMRRLRGPRGSKVKLGILRKSIKDTLTFTVTRDKIPVATLNAAYMVTPTVGLIRLSSFGSTSHDEMKKAIQELQAKGMKDLILDLQQNGGGYMEAATTIASEFLQKNDLIVYTKGLRTPYQEYRSEGSGLFREGRLIVLVDEYSASAAEIVTGAIQDQDRGLVVGRRTFGKGLVQKPFVLPDGSMIRLTVARYYTPSGRCIQKPYTMGDKMKYNMDVIERYNHGELTNADSIHFPDSLKYKTLREGRTVYGGGGIMPDYFIPLDTTLYTAFQRDLTAKGAIVNATLKFIDKNRKKIQREYSSFNKFKTNFNVPQELVDMVLDEGKKMDVKPKDDEELQKTMPELDRQLKALIARDIWDMSEYFAIMYEKNPFVLKALELLK
ncbi:MAG: S41 family peptidase [Paraprevotella sp.]|nr:S41 family peptidase [Paraprevotella sp.]